MELRAVYFDTPGSENTEAVLRIALQRAEELGIKTIVIASTTGDTAVKSMDVFQGLKVIAVTHITGFRTPDVQEFTAENRHLVESKGGTVVTAAHAFGGISRAMRSKHEMFVLGEIVADTLRIFGQGAGLVRTDEDIITIGGSNRGADTAVVLTPVNTHNFFDLKIREILCKPHF